MKRRKNSFRKYYRWFRRSWHRAYKKRVAQVERELGGELDAC